jgi:hypothetical protein
MVGSGLLATAQHGLASTGTTLDGATSTFQNLFLLGVFLLGFAGLATIVYTVARNRYGIIWDEALSVVKAVAVGASAVTILGWVGSTAAAPIVPQMAQEVVDVFAMWP